MLSAISKFLGYTEAPPVVPDEPITESRLDRQIEREQGALRNKAQAIDSHARQTERVALVARVLELRKSYDD